MDSPLLLVRQRYVNVRLVSLASLVGLTGLTLITSGCSVVSVSEQRLVSKPNMVFSESSVFDYSTGLHSRLEPGTAGAGGAQATGCTSCK